MDGVIGDARSVAGKTPVVKERAQLLVLGAGPAGLAAAREAARLGLKVMLIDEHPVDAAMMALDVPLHFGQRMDGSIRHRGRMLERIAASDPAIEEAFELGVDVRLGTCAWGAFANGPGVHWLPGPVMGLADDKESWLVGCERVVIAAGRRDMGIAFPGWHTAGVMGIGAAHALLGRYRAFAGRRIVILGSGAAALATAAAALDQGVEVAAIVEVAPALHGPRHLVEKLRRAGVWLATSAAVSGVEGTADGVCRATVVALDAELQPRPGSERTIDCDTICLGIAAVPNIELFDVLGCALTYDAALGGHVPLVDSRQRTSRPFVFAAGDCAGIFDEKTLAPAVAESEGRTAALSAALSLGAIDQASFARRAAELPCLPRPRPPAPDSRLDWVKALLNMGAADTVVCQCEEVSCRDILEVRAPRYLDWRGSGNRRRDLKTLLADGPPNQDQVKRLTRAGMGHCQGRRCREQIAMLLALAAGVDVGRIPLPTYRAPVRPLPLALLQDSDEAPAMAAGWDVWFGIPGQWTPYWEIDAPAEGGGETASPGHRRDG